VVDPGRRLVQASRDNDRVVREVRLGGRPGRRTVAVAPWQGVDSERTLRSAGGAARTFSCVLPVAGG
jgi:hypothetical protein